MKYYVIQTNLKQIGYEEKIYIISILLNKFYPRRQNNTALFTQLCCPIKKNTLCDLFFSFHRIDDNLLITGYADIPDECAREHAYKIYFAGNEKQEKLLDDILLHRQKLARMCNFPTYAHR